MMYEYLIQKLFNGDISDQIPVKMVTLLYQDEAILHVL